MEAKFQVSANLYLTFKLSNRSCEQSIIYHVQQHKSSCEHKHYEKNTH